ncbi:hypothetical protein [Mesorhizobium sp. LNJC394B00]|uniref:hypothetical protein n=1 Tax=Mesorhizobium sp. LNJC394B00 TaxID=1287274 RepID=UPI0003CDEE0D|nr:hypothetical protein [Mesorhizobium sp. LNJC394B00]ESY21430.1 hypothetical protein X750_16880 [Mesorhizobium sp. LNJC394B00]
MLDLRQRVRNSAETCWPPGSFLFSGVSAQGRATSPGGVARAPPSDPRAVKSDLLIFNCALRDELIRRAYAGDKTALRLLIPALPTDMPPSVVTAFRDHHLRELRRWLQAEIPNVTKHRCATIITAAAASLLAGRGLSDRSPFDLLKIEERSYLEAAVSELIHWTRKWPRTVKAITKIIG